MINLIRQRLFNKKGFSYFFIAVLFLILIMITAVIIEVIRINTICTNVRNKFENSLVAIATENYDVLFSSARDGYTASYVYSSSSWKNVNGVSKPRIEQEILHELNSGEKNQVNDIKNVEFTINQSKSNTGSRFTITGSCEAVIPFIFAVDGSFTVEIHANTQWTSQF